MNIRDFRYLVALAEHRHFGRAAAAVHVSQPTLSAQIRKLEDELGVILFERDSRNVGPTPAGAAIVAEARALLAHVAAVRDIADGFRDPLAGPFRLGVIASLGPFLAPELLAQVRHDAPRLAMSLHEGLTDDLLAALRGRNLDAALVATTPGIDDLVETPLFDEPFLIAHAPGHALAETASPRLADIRTGTLLLLAEGHCLRDQALSLCGTGAVDARVESTSLLTLMRLAAEGMGATLVPALAAPFAAGLELRPLGDAGASRRVRLAARRRDTRAGALATVAAATRAVAVARGMACISPA